MPMEDLLTRQAPHSQEAEQSVLGSMLIDSRCISDVVGVVRPEDFYLQANREIYEMAQENEAQNGMGTTAVVACLMESEAYIANVGDSRAYAYPDAQAETVWDEAVEDALAACQMLRENPLVDQERIVLVLSLIHI